MIGYLTTKIKYVINSFPDYFFVLIDMNYTTMKNFKNEIITLSERELILGFSLTYNLIGLIEIPFNDHYISIIINPSGKFIKKEFKNLKIINKIH